MMTKIRTVEGYELITIQQAAEMCGVTFQAVQKWIQSGNLKVLAQVGRVKLVDKAQVQNAADAVTPRKPRSGTPQEIGAGASAQG